MNYSFGEHQSIEHEITLDWGLSKNNRIAYRVGKTIYYKNVSKTGGLVEDLTYLSLAKKIKWEKKKTWVVIIAHKPNNRGDVANFVDTVSDAIKKAIDTDDCWYAFVIDYVIDDKKIIEIKVIQEIISP